MLHFPVFHLQARNQGVIHRAELFGADFFALLKGQHVFFVIINIFKDFYAHGIVPDKRLEGVPDFDNSLIIVPLNAGNILFQGFFRLAVTALLTTAANFDIDHDARGTGLHIERRIANVFGLFTENSAQQLLFRRQFRFTLGRHLADKDIACVNLGADFHNAVIVKIAQRFIAHIRNVARDFLWTKFGVPRFHFMHVDVNRGEHVSFQQVFTQHDSVFKIIAIPRHKTDKNITPQGKFTVFNGRPVGNNIPRVNFVVLADNRHLVDAGILV